MTKAKSIARREFLIVSAGGVAALAGLRSAKAATLPAWVSALPLMQWYAIPGTALSSVDPSPRPLGTTGPSAKIEAWCGAALKRSGSVYMLGAAGGHSDYGGNEVDALQLNTATPKWNQLKAPTPNASIINGTQFYLDLAPSSTHTYYASQFIEGLNRLVVFASPGVSGPFPAAPAGFAYTGDKRSFSFNVSNGTWDSPDYVAQFPGAGDFTACLCAKHPVTEDVYLSKNYGDGWYRWTRATNTWAKLSSASRGPWYAGAAIDPVRNRVLIVGGYDPMNAEVRNLDGSQINVTFGGLGGAALKSIGGYPGVVYDEAADKFMVFYNSGGSIAVVRVDPQTWAVDKPALTGSAPASRVNGIQNSVQYVPELGGVVIANSYAGNVYFMRTTGGGVVTPPPVDTTPPASPTGLSIT